VNNPDQSFKGGARMTGANVRRAGCVTLALVGALGAAIQAALLYGSGKAICLNEGCRVIEGLTRVPPLFINLAGLGFFDMFSS